MAGCIWLQKAPGVLGMGPFNIPTSGGRGKRDALRVPATLPITMSPEAAETLRESLGEALDKGEGPCGGGVWGSEFVGVILSSAQGPLVRSAWLGTGESRRMLSPQRPGGLPLPAQPGGLTEPLHRLGKQTLGGAAPRPPPGLLGRGSGGENHPLQSTLSG